MTKTTQTTTPPTRFTCHAPRAQTVTVAGSFNGWNPTATPLTRESDGSWNLLLSLPPGRHEFKFVVDGAWCCEPGCEGTYHGCPKCVPNELGTMNRVVEVGG